MKKHPFRLVLLILLLALIALAVWWAIRFFSAPSTDRPKDYRTDIVAYVSQMDRDGDGVDDQTDILESVLSYIETEPLYQSKYYTSGYPDDGYGVCTDVVAFGLLGAGYDLQELVDEDIRNHPEDYAIESPDKNIDFRRVRNLRVYFEHTAISLTTDPKEIEEWQGGDIVVFQNHIGVVSDRRNKNGVPYVIHHYSPSQKRYEEDILEQRGDIVGHFRIS